MVLVVAGHSHCRFNVFRFVEVLRHILQLNTETIKLDLEVHPAAVEQQAFICHRADISCMIGWQTFKFKESLRCLLRIIQIAFGYGWTADDDFSLLAIRYLLPFFVNDKGRRVRLGIANRQALAILQHLICHCYCRQGYCCLSRTVSIDNASLREAIAQLLSCLDCQLLTVKVEMRQLRQLLAVKVIRQQGHVRKGRCRSPDSNRQTENRLKQLLEILSHCRRQGKKSPSQGQSRRPIHD